jgi:hypothetical protein
MKITKDSIWLYVGPGSGNNIEHKVLMAYEDVIVTWSNPKENPKGCGYSWLGSRADFLKNFQPAQHV